MSGQPILNEPRDLAGVDILRRLQIRMLPLPSEGGKAVVSASLEAGGTDALLDGQYQTAEVLNDDGNGKMVIEEFSIYYIIFLNIPL